MAREWVWDITADGRITATSPAIHMTHVAKGDVLVTTDHGETTDLRYRMVGDSSFRSRRTTVFTLIHAKPEQSLPRR